MIGKIIWSGSGDELRFRATRPDLLEYYVGHLNRDDKNDFCKLYTRINFKLIEKLQGNLDRTRPIEKQRIKILENWEGDLLDQAFLNQMHHDWVVSGQKYPTLPLLLRALGGRDQDYREINTTLHDLESMFVSWYCNYDQDPYQIANPFGHNLMGFETDNVMLGFDNLGRSSWDKFLNWDKNIEDIDTNDHQHLSGKLNINLNRPMAWKPPDNYIDWCKLHNRAVVGRHICLGTFVDLEENLTKYRHIMLANNEQSNRIILEISS